MKKLISIFAALALVGSLAAQKKKPAAKAPAAPAAPAVAAPAAPVVAAPAMPTSGAAAKGMGLFVDLRGSYTFANGTSDSKADGSAQTDTTDTVVTFKTSASQAIGGGISIGYEIAPGLSLVGSYDIRSFKTREYKGLPTNYSTSLPLSNADATAQQKWTNQVIGLGIRPSVNALGGEVYAGGGLAIVLPFETTNTLTISNATAAFNTATSNTTSVVQVAGYNMAFGAYGEVGYKFMLTDMIGLNLGLRTVVATANNIDKTMVQTQNASTTVTTTTTYKESYSTTQFNAADDADTTTTKAKIAAFQTLGITDFSANLGVSLKF